MGLFTKNPVEPRCTQDFNRLQRNSWSTTPLASSEQWSNTDTAPDSDYDLKYSLSATGFSEASANGCGQREALSQSASHASRSFLSDCFRGGAEGPSMACHC